MTHNLKNAKKMPSGQPRIVNKFTKNSLRGLPIVSVSCKKRKFLCPLPTTLTIFDDRATSANSFHVTIAALNNSGL